MWIYPVLLDCAVALVGRCRGRTSHHRRLNSSPEAFASEGVPELIGQRQLQHDLLSTCASPESLRQLGR